jgi:hypothetical protein
MLWAFRHSLLCFLSSLIAFAGIRRADTMSFTGTLLDPEDTAQIAFALATPGTVAIQTYGFGTGPNANVPAGGFDPFVALFFGIGDTAVFIDGTSDILSNYSPGCPPAGTMTVGSAAGQCAVAVFEGPGGALGDGFTDVTSSVFQTCVDAGDRNTDTANWAIDLTTSGGASPASRPGSRWLVGCAHSQRSETMCSLSTDGCTRIGLNCFRANEEVGIASTADYFRSCAA